MARLDVVYARFHLWGIANKETRRVAVNPVAVASFKQEGHHPPAVTIELYSGTKHLVSGSYDEVEAALKAAAEA